MLCRSRTACLALSSVFLALAGAAQEEDEGKDAKGEWRYQIVNVDGRWLVFDRRTKQVEWLAPPPLPAALKEGTVVQSGAGPSTPTPAPSPSAAPPVPQRPPTDELRKEAEAAISSYRGSLGLRQTVKVLDGRVSGTIAVTNDGPRRLLALEVTLAVSEASGARRELHRYLMGSPGHPKPPEPTADGSHRPASVYLPIDFPAPPGNPRFDIAVTYLKFAE